MKLFSLFAGAALAVALSVAMPAAADPYHYDSVADLVTDFSDYLEEHKQFEVLSERPLHIRLSPVVFEGDHPDVVESELRRAMVYGIYRSFVHTDIEAITVTTTPVLGIFMKPDQNRVLDKPQITITKTRAEALADVQQFIKVTELSELIDSQDSLQPGSKWIKEFNQLYYPDQGGPGLNVFYEVIAG